MNKTKRFTINQVINYAILKLGNYEKGYFSSHQLRAGGLKEILTTLRDGNYPPQVKLSNFKKICSNEKNKINNLIKNKGKESPLEDDLLAELEEKKNALDEKKETQYRGTFWNTIFPCCSNFNRCITRMQKRADQYEREGVLAQEEEEISTASTNDNSNESQLSKKQLILEQQGLNPIVEEKVAAYRVLELQSEICKAMQRKINIDIKRKDSNRSAVSLFQCYQILVVNSFTYTDKNIQTFKDDILYKEKDGKFIISTEQYTRMLDSAANWIFSFNGFNPDKLDKKNTQDLVKIKNEWLDFLKTNPFFYLVKERYRS